MRFVLFLFIALIVITLLTLYVDKRLINKLDIKQTYKKYFKRFLYINYLGIFGYIYIRYNPNVPNEIFFLFSLPFGVLFLLLCIAIFYDITHSVLNKTPIENSRREFLKKGLDSSSVVISVALIGRSLYEATFLEVEHIEIKIDNLYSEYKIVQLSDVHIGGLISAKQIAKIVQKTNDLHPDLVVITGDLVDIALVYAKDALDELQKLKSKYGTYFIVGNHEYIHGVDEIMDAVKRRGITVLENESVFIGDKNNGFNLVGVYDVMGNRVGHHKPDIKKAMSTTNSSRPTVLLAHQPRYINELEDKRIDLVLSGHTHGGQIYPFRVLVSLVQPYVAGLYKHNDTTQIYVNKGTGYWGPPMRLGTSCEITNITLRSTV
jgi:predicted MPP superfamily phosphohydrolase